jgi:alpha-D-ribose 1-methylphosphonate 5-triphosphate synthase subunit PhnI
MAYVSVMGGQEAIAQANQLTQFFRLRNSDAALTIDGIEHRLRLLSDRVMSEGGLYALSYAALSIFQSEGDPFEAAFLLRAYRSTLARNQYTLTMEPGRMRIIRRISSSFRDIPGGQILGPTYDYTHRLLDFSLRGETAQEVEAFVREYLAQQAVAGQQVEELTFAKVADLLRSQGLVAATQTDQEEEPYDVTREKLTFPAPRSARLQALARGETGAMTALAYGSMRGYGAVHPTIGELRVGYVPAYIPYPFASEDDQTEEDAVYIGEIMMTEVESINSFQQDAASGQVQFQLGYGLCFGQNEVKAISMSILEHSLEKGGDLPTQDEEFVLSHIDSVESSGFVSHLKLPHYVTFQSELDRIRDVKVSKEQQSEQKMNEQEEVTHEQHEAPTGV